MFKDVDEGARICGPEAQSLYLDILRVEVVFVFEGRERWEETR